MPTLNAMDNNGEAFATVLILMNEGKPVIMRNREGCVGGGTGPMYSDKSFTLATSNDQLLIFSHTQGLDIQASATNSPTLRTGNTAMSISTESVVRRLTPTECERLQGFPDGWTDGQADSNRYKQMGNAVAVPVVQWIISNFK